MPTPSDSAEPRGTFHSTDRLQPGRLGTFDQPDIPAQLACQAAAQRELRGEVERLRAERDRLLDRQRQVVELLRSANPEKIVHDLRNVLNELHLYKMLAETQPK